MSRYVRSAISHRHPHSKQYDPVNIDVAVMRGGVSLHPLEMTEAVRRLARVGRSARQIAVHLGTTDRTVQRARARLRAAGVRL